MKALDNDSGLIFNPRLTILPDQTELLFFFDITQNVTSDPSVKNW